VNRRRLGPIIALVLVRPWAAMGQPAARLPRVGVIGEQSVGEARIEAFRQGLRDLGYVDGQNIVIDYRYLKGQVDQAQGFAMELVRLQPDVLVVGGTVAAQAAKAATATVPIVFAAVADPVASGLVGSLARPAGNVTGLSVLGPQLSAKQLELLKATVPRVGRVGVLFNPANPATAAIVAGTRQAARALALQLQVIEVRRSGELAGAFSAMVASKVGAVLVVSDPLFGGDLVHLSDLAAANRLPAIYSRREFAEAGGLLAYGSSFSENYRRAAGYVDKILRGARPADLPVEQPTRFELVINQKTARAIGITVPQPVLLRADEVIQ
jgi:putative tryptophan/tyrosine transport system substrate-binding protein